MLGTFNSQPLSSISPWWIEQHYTPKGFLFLRLVQTTWFSFVSGIHLLEIPHSEITPQRHKAFLPSGPGWQTYTSLRLEFIFRDTTLRDYSSEAQSQQYSSCYPALFQTFGATFKNNTSENLFRDSMVRGGYHCSFRSKQVHLHFNTISKYHSQKL